MKMNKKMMTAISVASVIVLATTGIVNATMVSGYNVFKAAAKTSMALPNATVVGKMSVTVDGKTIEEDAGMHVMIQQTQDGDYVRKSTSKSVYSDENGDRIESDYEFYETSGKNISVSQDGETGEKVYYVSTYQSTAANNVSGASKEIITFLEVLADSFAGDAKEYLQKTDVGEGYLIKADFDRTQVPTITNAVLDLAVSEMMKEETRLVEGGYQEAHPDEFQMLMREGISDAYIDKVTIDSKVTKAGHFEYVKATITANFETKSGTVFPIVVEGEFQFLDVGTTVVSLPDLNGKNVVNNKTYENIEINELLVDDVSTLMDKIMWLDKSKISAEQEKEIHALMQQIEAIIDEGDAEKAGKVKEVSTEAVTEKETKSEATSTEAVEETTVKMPVPETTAE